MLVMKEDNESLEDNDTLLQITESDKLWYDHPDTMLLFRKNGLKHYHFVIKHEDNVYFTWFNYRRIGLQINAIYIVMPFKDFDPSKISSYTKREIPGTTKRRMPTYDMGGAQRVKAKIVDLSLSFYFWKVADEESHPELIANDQEQETLFEFNI